MAVYGNEEKMELRPCKAYIDDGSGEYPVGLTKDGYKTGYSQKWKDMVADETGEVPMNYMFTGAEGSVKFTCLETTLEKLKLAIPISKMLSDGTRKALAVGLEIGAKASSKAVKFRLHPMNTRLDGEDDETYRDDDTVIWKCLSMDAVENTSSGKDFKAFDINLKVMPDLSKPKYACLWIHGDPALLTAVDTTPPSTVMAVESGTAQAGGATSINLASSASAVDDYYNGMSCYVAGKGHGVITDYDGTSKVATVADWLEGSDPTNGDTYSIRTKNVKVSVGGVMTLINPDTALAGVALDTAILIGLSEELPSGSGYNLANYMLKNVANNSFVSCAVAYDATAKTVTLTPSANLTSGVTYELIINNLVDLSGNRMTAAECVRFTTI